MSVQCSSVSIFGVKSGICSLIWKCFSYGMIATCRQWYPSSTQISVDEASKLAISNATQKSVMKMNHKEVESFVIVWFVIKKACIHLIFVFWILYSDGLRQQYSTTVLYGVERNILSFWVICHVSSLICY